MDTEFRFKKRHSLPAEEVESAPKSKANTSNLGWHMIPLLCTLFSPFHQCNMSVKCYCHDSVAFDTLIALILPSCKWPRNGQSGGEPGPKSFSIENVERIIMRLDHRSGSHQNWVLFPPLLLRDCVTSGKSFYLSLPPFPHLYIEEDGTCLLGVLEGLVNELPIAERVMDERVYWSTK